MKLVSLDIRALPGIEQPFSIDFEADAVNVVTGPNASGKSSLVRAVRALLYPDLHADYCQLEAVWRHDDHALTVHRQGDRVTWLADDKPVSRPSLPGPDSLGAFLISAEDLNAMGSTESHISDQLRTQLAGGYDLDAVLGQRPLLARPKPQKQARELAELGSRLVDKESEYAALNDELADLDRLNTELTATNDAAAGLRACEDALALADIITQRSAVEQTLIEEFPGGMDRLRGDELERLDQLTERISDREKELAIEHGARRQARDGLEKSGAVEPQTLEALQSELSDRRDQLAVLEREIAECGDTLAQHRAAMATAARRLGSRSPEISEQLDQPALEEMERLVDRVQVLREQIRNLTAELARTHSSKSASGHSQSDLREARQALLDWLEGARLSPLEGALWGGLAVAAGIATWRLLAVQEVPASPELILIILLAAGLPLTLLAQLLPRLRGKAQARNEFDETGLEAPLGWTESEVEAHIERLDLELESATQHEITQARAAEVRSQLNTQRTSLESARQRLREYAGKLGISADSRLETGFLLWCRHLHDWQGEQLAGERAQRQLDQLRARYAALQSDTTGLLERHGMSHETDVSSRDLASLIHLLNPRMRRNAELHNQLTAHQRRIDELQADIEQLGRMRDKLYRDCGLEPDQRDRLVRRIEQYEAWRELEQRRRDDSMELTRLEERLAGEPELLRQARAQEREALEQRHESLKAQVARRDELNRRIARIHARHEDLLRRRELETLSSQWEQQRQSLDEELDQHLLTGAARALIEDVRIAHQADNEPPALARAGAWFNRFTRHRYRLQFDDSRFIAVATRSNRRTQLNELSTGTRVQLLLAVRLAWIEQAEKGSESLPVFMDEVLTTTDPDRYQAVVESVQEIAVGGRQMFYLTAQTDDAHAWSEWAREGPSPHLIDMADVRRGQIEPLQYSMPVGVMPASDIPDPGGRDPLNWADEVGVEAIDPWQSPGQLHVFHILHDRLDLTVRLMKLDLARLGELEAFLGSEQARRFLPEDDCNELRRRAAAAHRIIEDWQSRHYRPVDQAALHACGLISDHFLPRVCELNRTVDGHPRKLIDGLREGRVARFRSDTTDQLEQWLDDHAFLNREKDRPRSSAARISLDTGLSADRITDLRAWINGAISDAAPTSD
jgi:DNA repair exonuclease SbcCD ATPase subunit